MSRRPRVLAVLGAIAAIAVVTAAAWPSGSESDSSQGTSAAAPTARATAANDEAPLRRRRRQAVEPVAGENAAVAALPGEPAGDGADAPSTGPTASTSEPDKRSGVEGPTGDSAISDAVVLKNGIALPPIEAPYAVERIIEAGNQIARTRYLWGGGHGKWLDKGYDCSGSVSYALAAAGLLNSPLDSGRLMGWGKPGKGKWVTIYSNPGHVFLVVAGVRFDTSGTRKTGSRWQASMRPGGGFVARHPPAL